MTAFPTPGVTPSNWGAQLNTAIQERFDALPETLSDIFATFVDHITGEPIAPPGRLLIKVNVTTGEIDDIVFEEGV